MAQNDNIEIDEEFGKILRLQREASELSRAALAEATGISWQQLQKYESGKNRVSVSRLFLLAEALQTKPEQLMAILSLRVFDERSDGEPDVSKLKTTFTDSSLRKRLVTSAMSLDNKELLVSIVKICEELASRER